MLFRVASFSLRLAPRRGVPLSHCQCYSTGSPLPNDPLVADVLKEPVKRKESRIEWATKTVPAFEGMSEGRLPPMMEWRKYFPFMADVNHRISIRNPETAAVMAETFVPEGSNGKVIIEAFPGPGQLTRALLALPKERIRKLIVMETTPLYLKYLRPLQELDSRITVIPHSGYEWDAYDVIESMGLLKDVPKLAWDAGVHPGFQFISHIPSTVSGEQLISQFFRSIPEKHWVFKYGRTPLNFILGENVWRRISAAIGAKSARCKVSVIAEAVAECTEALPFSKFQPYQDHFHPTRSLFGSDPNLKYNARRTGNPFQAIKVIPREHQVIPKGDLDSWDFCLRRLFVRKATPLKTGLGALAPGAQSLLKVLTNPDLPESDRVDITKTMAHLTIQDWAAIVKAFKEWPFMPENLSIDDTFMMRDPR
ncbi:S-adenosyl-L-methionine-dependent methyltransferase [Collybia nuda]|uniref:rRNA adenine N(6)-methyltransferase n=1 Tax=Collybia nuda TaxID=64659 RepID=A0A9P5Y635_9AGAR|nr:S-adenosyl-L-methionine-dependent methyltransferase [Collybia nuda]